jgi:hypothetical protein
VPPATPVTTPLVEPTVAIAALLLLHAPPDTVFDKAEVEPAHADNVPDIDDGVLVILTAAVLTQPVGNI